MSAGSVTLDDTLHAVVQLTHEHGLPLNGVSANRGDVLVFCDLADLRWWVQWLTPVAGHRLVAWRKDGDIAVALSGVRDGITWAVHQNIPTTVADPILTQHGVTITENHERIAPAVVIALTSQDGERT